MILPVQNGIDSAERIGRVVGPGHVIGGLAGVSSVVAAPGVIEHRAGPDAIQLGELAGGSSARTERIADTLRRAGMKAQVRPDIRVALWEKFVLICGLSGLTALTRLPLGAVLACPETRALFRQAMEETDAVGRAEGVALPDGVAERMLQFFEGSDPAIRGSLYYDLAAGRRLEIETLNGTVVRLGRRARRPHPGELRRLRGPQAVRGRRAVRAVAGLTPRSNACRAHRRPVGPTSRPPALADRRVLG